MKSAMGALVRTIRKKVAMALDHGYPVGTRVRLTSASGVGPEGFLATIVPSAYDSWDYTIVFDEDSSNPIPVDFREIKLACKQDFTITQLGTDPRCSGCELQLACLGR